jgi:hypothetical protein
MSKEMIQNVVEASATTMKVVGALVLGVAFAPLAAFSALLAGCTVSVMSALRTGDRSAV